MVAPSKSLDRYDLIFAGGGFSTAITLTYLLRELGEHQSRANGRDKDTDTPLIKIAVFDNFNRFPKGIAYSEDEDSGAFLITPASEMMPPVAGGGNALTAWLTQKPASWADRLERSQSSIVQAWLPALIDAVEQQDFNRVFVPRSVIGWFIEDQVYTAISDAEIAGYAQVDIHPTEVTRVQHAPENGCLVATTATGDEHEAGQLVVAIGSGKFGSLCPDGQTSDHLMKAPLENGVSALRRMIEARIEDLGGETSPKVLVIGSNASALDVVSVLLDIHRVQGTTAQITSISPSGHFPPEFQTNTMSRPDPDPCQALSALVATKTAPTAKMIYDCAVKDRKRLVQDGIHIGVAKALIFEHVLKLIARLDAEGKREFVEVYGNDLSCQFYMTSPVYAQLYRDAIDNGQVKMITGKVKHIQVTAQGVDVDYAVAEDVMQDRFDLVIDCTGFEFPLAKSSVPLVQSLFSDLGAEANRSGRGFRTRQDSFEIAQSVFVLGPLYAGNVDATGVCRWHLETTRGISEIARIFATDIVDQMF